MSLFVMDNEGQVASILVDFGRLIMESTHHVPFENVLRWGVRRCRTKLLYEKKKEEVTTELLEVQLKPVGIRQPTNLSSLNFIIKLAPPSQLALIQPSIKKIKGEFNLDATVASQARKRRMEILQERRTLSTCKRQRVE